ncbi:MAG: hypothetical protein GSR78_05135 [Desulfurococcales archaeon]|nr:hypothetical protein [Desulfurococcales archaeon]
MDTCIEQAVRVIREFDKGKNKSSLDILVSEKEFMIHHIIAGGMSIAIRGLCTDKGGLIVVGEGYGVISAFKSILKDRVSEFYEALLTLGTHGIVYPILAPSGAVLFIPAKEIVLFLGSGGDSSMKSDYKELLQAIIVNMLGIAIWLEMNYNAALDDEPLIPYDVEKIEKLVQKSLNRMKGMSRGPLNFI